MKHSRLLIPAALFALLIAWLLFPDGAPLTMDPVDVRKNEERAIVDRHPDPTNQPVALTPQKQTTPTAQSPAAPPKFSGELAKSFAAAQHAVYPLRPEHAALPQNQDVAFFAAHPTHDFTMRFQQDGGLRLDSGDPDKTWSATVRLAGSEEATVRQTGAARVEITHGPKLIEWYENKPEGLEHGFVLLDASVDMLPDPGVQLQVTLKGLQANTSDQLAGTIFLGEHDADDSGRDHRLGYTDLKVWDATGTDVPAEMYPVDDGWVIAMQDTGMHYPLTVDPLFFAPNPYTPTVYPTFDPPGGGSIDRGFASNVTLNDEQMFISAIEFDTPIAFNAGAVLIYSRTNGLWVYEDMIWDPNGSRGSAFGTVLSLNGNTLAVTSPGSVHVFERKAGTWTHQQRLIRFDGDFGSATALQGDTLVVSSPGDRRPAGSNSGSVTVYNRNGDTWADEQLLVPSDTRSNLRFGTSLSIDGDTLIVGVTGAVYEFTLIDNVWTEQPKLTAFDGEGSFGSSVDLSGNTLAIGAPLDQTPANRAGSVYVYVRQGAGWSLQQKLPGDVVEGRVGGQVVLDGDRLFAGRVYARSGTFWIPVPFLIEDDAGYDSRLNIRAAVSGGTLALFTTTFINGSVEVFEFTSPHWVLGQTILLDSTHQDGFGGSVDMYEDWAVVGAHLDDTAGGKDAGSVYLFHRETNAWTFSQNLYAPGAVTEERFGSATDIVGDTLAVGTGRNAFSEANIKHVYVFRRTGSEWQWEQTLNGPEERDDFGSALALSGNTLLVGAPGAMSPTAFVFNRSGNTWALHQTLTGSLITSSNPRFGQSVALDGDLAAIGAPTGDLGGRGEAFIFARNGTTWNEIQYIARETLGNSDRIGIAVAVAGERIAISEKSRIGSSRPAVNLFVPGTTNWVRQAVLMADEADDSTNFGNELSLYGPTLAANADDSVYIFAQIGTNWVRQQRIQNAIGGFGRSVALFDQSLIVGTPAHFLDIQAPVLTLAPQTFPEARTGSILSELGIVNQSNEWSYTLVDGDGDEDNAFFSVGTSNLLSAGVDYEVKTNYTIRVRADDGIQRTEEMFALSVLDDRNEDADQDGLSEAEEEDTYGTSDTEPDDDGDGIPGGIEVNAGLNPALNDSDLIDSVRENPSAYGVDLTALAGGTPLVKRDPADQAFHLRIAVQRTDNLQDFEPVEVQIGQAHVNATSNLEIDLVPIENFHNYRVIATGAWVVLSDPATTNSPLATAICNHPEAFGIQLDPLAVGSVDFTPTNGPMPHRLTLYMTKADNTGAHSPVVLQPENVSVNQGVIELTIPGNTDTLYYRVVSGPLPDASNP